MRSSNASSTPHTSTHATGSEPPRLPPLRLDEAVDFGPELFRGDPLDDGVQEPLDDEAASGLRGDPARLEVEDLVLVDLLHRGRVLGADDLGRLDLEPGDRHRLRLAVQEERELAEVRVRIEPLVVDRDHAL